MGRKPDQPKDKAGPKAEEAKKAETEDSPIVTNSKDVQDPPLVLELKEIDDRYLAIEREYEKEVEKLMAKYEALQQPMLEERSKKLANKEGSSLSNCGTPACPGFWCQALKHHPAFGPLIEEWDEPILQFLKDIQHEPLDSENRSKGFRLKFLFAENKWFDHLILTKEYHLEEENPYTRQENLKLIRADEITWKPGMDVTVHTVAKKVKGGGAKKAKQKKEKQEPRPSFFRMFFRTLKEGEPVPGDLKTMYKAMMGGDDDESGSFGDDDEDVMEELMDNDHEAGTSLRDSVIPYAVRWYTGECAPEDSDDDDDDEDEEEEDDEDDEESEEEDKKGKKKPTPPKKGKSSPAIKPAEEPKEQQECKQQ